MGGALSRPGMTRIWHDLFFFSFLRSAARFDTEHIIARQLTQLAPSRTAIWLNPPALVRFPAEPLAPGAKF